MRPTDHADNRIAKYLKEDEGKAFDLLFREYFHKLFLFACKHLRDEHKAEDLIMDVMLNFWERRTQFLAVENIEAFLYQSVRNKIVDHYRKKSLQTEPIEEATHLSSSFSTDAQAHFKDTKKIYCEALGQLSEQRRKVFELRRHEFLSVSEVAQKLNISSKTVENHMTAALNFLKQYLKKTGVAGILLFLITIK
ncbi:RNA polymerase sigma-70 factor [Desertivirga brevis]|uniref:RNA polymerase sigma-70 factor n=1 Tax=Desertivirga brevis TaxID=2810310 RepID=UPI001A964919|nr:RNA polymerase sigma-70 factor [Pedobacter sp. SYSU D00873]